MGVVAGKKLLAIVTCLAVSVPAVADAGQGRRRGHHVPVDNAPQSAYDDGYRQGVRQGEVDASSGRGFDPRRSSPGRSDHALGYAEGYRTGFDRQHAMTPWRREPPSERITLLQRGGPRPYAEPAFAAGYEAGYERGVADGRGGERYDPVRHRAYRDAERGHRESYGSIDAYRNNFRLGFRQGYEEGYRAGARNRR